MVFFLAIIMMMKKGINKRTHTCISVAFFCWLSVVISISCILCIVCDALKLHKKKLMYGISRVQIFFCVIVIIMRRGIIYTYVHCMSHTLFCFEVHHNNVRLYVMDNYGTSVIFFPLFAKTNEGEGVNLARVMSNIYSCLYTAIRFCCDSFHAYMPKHASLYR